MRTLILIVLLLAGSNASAEQSPIQPSKIVLTAREVSVGAGPFSAPDGATVRFLLRNDTGTSLGIGFRLGGTGIGRCSGDEDNWAGLVGYKAADKVDPNTMQIIPSAAAVVISIRLSGCYSAQFAKATKTDVTVTLILATGDTTSVIVPYSMIDVPIVYLQ